MKYEITKEQINQLLNETHRENEDNLKKWFPEAFTQLSSDFTGWAKSTVIDNEKWLMYFEKGILKYGFDANGDWFLPYSVSNIKKSDIEATKSEVFEALKKEAVRRYKVGDYIDCLHHTKYGFVETKIYEFDFSCLRLRNNRGYVCCVFQKGKWAEIIETITKEEAEKLLNKKII